MHQERLFQFALSGVLGEREKVEIVGIFDELLREVRIRFWEGRPEVGYRSALPAVEPPPRSA
jgi:hypothetical protein